MAFKGHYPDAIWVLLAFDFIPKCSWLATGLMLLIFVNLWAALGPLENEH